MVFTGIVGFGIVIAYVFVGTRFLKVRPLTALADIWDGGFVHLSHLFDNIPGINNNCPTNEWSSH